MEIVIYTYIYSTKIKITFLITYWKQKKIKKKFNNISDEVKRIKYKDIFKKNKSNLSHDLYIWAISK